MTEPTRKRLLVGNWKMHKTVAEAEAFLEAFLAEYEPHPNVEVAIAPPFTSLSSVAARLRGRGVALGAQTMHWAPMGAYTGEISGAMLAELGVRYVIVGHSERRAYCDETDRSVNLKVSAALEYGLTPIVAVGESSEQHERGETLAHVLLQTRAAFAGLDDGAVARCVVAYEPVWAIGSGSPDTPESADAVMGAIRDALPGLAGVQLLYGGSVKLDNVTAFCTRPNIDGGLIGGASLAPGSFAALVRRTIETCAAL